ncbi:MAG TPA: alpha/beta hydrolase [Anaerolineales bacterium]|nr:alpha/beta hydrolase [Anaerolineales bacterium]
MLFPVRNETKEMNADARNSAGGSFIQLPGGITHYETGGNESSEIVVLAHGFSVPYFIYDPTFESLSHSGFRVIRYDLFGRGYSDRPQAKYDIDFFVTQLADLLDVLRISSPVSLVGLSMGGPIASTFAVRHPERIRNLVLIDPAGAKPISTSPLLWVAKLPQVAEAVLRLVGSDFMVESIADDFFDPALVAHFQERYRVQMQYKGFMYAILSTIRNGMFSSFLDAYRQLGAMETRVLLFWGRNDKTVPFEHSALLREAIPNLEFHAIEGCGHLPHYEKPEQVNPILLEFLRQT